MRIRKFSRSVHIKINTRKLESSLESQLSDKAGY
jgi:hypothetical protein